MCGDGQLHVDIPGMPVTFHSLTCLIEEGPGKLSANQI